MKISGIIWIDEIIDKLERKHNVQQDEVNKFFATIRISASLKQATGQEKTSTLQWEEPTQAAT